MLRKVCACRTDAEAGMVISLLKNNGFFPLDLQISPHNLLSSGADLFFYVQVPDEEYESAKTFLLEYFGSDENIL